MGRDPQRCAHDTAGQPAPLTVDRHDLPWLSPQRQRQLIWLLIGMGVAARAVRFLLRFPLWPDESYLATNFLDRGYLGLMERLDQDQVSPLLFLWAELTCVRVLGFTEYTLRLFPFLCGIGSLFVFRHLADRLLSGTAQVFAVGVFAVAYPLIRYSAETKPYATDLFVSLVLVTLFVEWWRAERKGPALAALLLFTPLALGLSYPAAFVGGAISVAMAVNLFCGGAEADSTLSVGWTSVRPGVRRGWLGWGALNLCLAGSFLAWFALCTRNQSGMTLETMHDCWQHTFPPLDSPWRLVKWLAVTHLGDMVGYPVGELSALSAVACGVGLVVLVRRRQYTLICLAACPLALNMIAAGLQRYPYGGSVRFMLYAAPAMCLLIGLGAARVLAGSSRVKGDSPIFADTKIGTVPRPRVLGAAVVLLAIVAVSSMVRDFLHPYKRPEFQRERDFARWFWTSKAEDAELVCLANDYQPSIMPRHTMGFAESLYFCNQRIYSPRHARGQAPQLDRVAADRPLRCVELLTEKLGHGETFHRWMADMKSRYDLANVETHHILARSKAGEVLYRNCVQMYEFVPKKGEKTEAVTERPAPQPTTRR